MPVQHILPKAAESSCVPKDGHNCAIKSHKKGLNMDDVLADMFVLAPRRVPCLRLLQLQHVYMHAYDGQLR